MNKIILFLAVLFYFTGTVEAMVSINAETVKSAQAYGLAGKDLSAGVLLSKWTIPDSKKLNRFGINEKVIIYTPYAVAAVDAQDRAKSGQSIEPKDGLAIAQEYEGILALGAIINSSFRVEPKDLTVQILQAEKKILPYDVTLYKAVAQDFKISRNKLLFDSRLQTGTVEQAQPLEIEKGKIIPVVVEATAPKDSVSEDIVVKVWDMQYFIYFDLTKIDPTKSAILTIADQAGGIREFKINLMDMN